MATQLSSSKRPISSMSGSPTELALDRSQSNKRDTTLLPVVLLAASGTFVIHLRAAYRAR